MKSFRPLVAVSVLALSVCSLAASAGKPKETKTEEPAPVPNRHLTRNEYLVRDALAYRGVRYRFGGTSRSGIDCSGLTQAVYRHYGMLIPRASVDQFRKGIPVPKDQLKPGDLVFFKNTYKRGISHVGIYVGDGKFVHAASSKLGVIVSSLSQAHYVNHWAGARRLAIEKEPINPDPPIEQEPPAETIAKPDKTTDHLADTGESGQAEKTKGQD